MSQLGAFLLVHVFTAVLPPKDDDDDEEYYQILGLSASKRTTPEDIRKAYRQISLELHPDKIAQRGGVVRMPKKPKAASSASNNNNNNNNNNNVENGDDNNNDNNGNNGNPATTSVIMMTADEAAARYEKVQQAYSVLSDKKERHKYHAVNCSPARYKFVYQQGWMHPMSIMENISKASCWDKFRLVLVVFVALFAILLQPILICAVLEQKHPPSSANWLLVMTPFWIVLGIYTLLQLMVFLWTKQRDYLLEMLQCVCYFVGSMLVVSEFNNDHHRPRASENWYHLATPFYLAVFIKAAALSERVRALERLQQKFVSPEQMIQVEQDYQEERRRRRQEQYQQQQQFATSNNDTNNNTDATIPDVTEDELEALRQDYVVVTPNALAVAAALLVLETTAAAEAEEAAEQQGDGNNPSPSPAVVVSDEELEALKVQSSPEYQHLQAQITRVSVGVVQVLVYGITIISLLAAKLEDRISANWWIVFLPVWIFLGLQMLQSCGACCFCGTGGSGESFMEMEEDEDEEDDEDAEEEEDEEEDGHTEDNKNKMDEEQGGGGKGQDDDEDAADVAVVASNTGTSDTTTDEDDPSATPPKQSELSLSSEPEPLGDNNKDNTGDDDDDDGNGIEVNLTSSSNDGVVQSPAQQQQQQSEQQQPETATSEEQGMDSRGTIDWRDEEEGGQRQEQNQSISGDNPQTPPPPKSPLPTPESQASGALFESVQSGRFFQRAAEEQERQNANDANASSTPNNNMDGIPEMDEEDAFRQWQRAHAEEADNDAVEAAVRAQWTCCTSLFQLLTVALIVGKLQQEDDNKNHSSSEFNAVGGYNAYWILFPSFVVAGLLLCCCCCLVYTTPDVSKMEEYLKQEQEQEGGGANDGGGDEEQGVLTPPPPPPPTQAEADAATSSNGTTNSSSTNNESPSTPTTADKARAETTTTNTDDDVESPAESTTIPPPTEEEGDINDLD